MGCIYRLVSPSGKSYIGITSKSTADRWKQHRHNASKGRMTAGGVECIALYNAIRKYGHSAFLVETIGESNHWETLIEMEQMAITEYGSFSPNGYNLTRGGDGALGAVPSRKSRERMSAAQMKRLEDPEALAEAKKHLLEAVRIRAENWHKRTPEEKAEWGKRHGELVSKGHSTPESRRRTSDAQKKRFAKPEAHQQLSLAQTGVKRAPWTEERKQRAAAKRKEEWADPLMRAKRLAGLAAARQAKNTEVTGG